MAKINMSSCSLVRKYVKEAIDDLEDGEKGEKARKHERKHFEQKISMAPSFLFFLPDFLRALIGYPKFFVAYRAEHKRAGYIGNKFEVEAREAEEIKQ